MNKSLIKIFASSWTWVKIVLLILMLSALYTAVTKQINKPSRWEKAVYFCDGKENIKQMGGIVASSVTCNDGRDISNIDDVEIIKKGK